MLTVAVVGAVSQAVSNACDGVDNWAGEHWDSNNDQTCGHAQEITQGADMALYGLYFAFAVVFILPIPYLYFWIVVNSLRKSTRQAQMVVVPIQTVTSTMPMVQTY